MSKENATVFLQVHRDCVEIGKKKLTVSEEQECSGFICKTVANSLHAYNMHGYHFDIVFHVLFL